MSGTCDRFRVKVYPRVRGEARNFQPVPLFAQGLSPRPRGSPYAALFLCLALGSIPASAGKPCCLAFKGDEKQVYPRVRGEAFMVVTPTIVTVGLSPRPRGSHLCTLIIFPIVGSIPASAGKPLYFYALHLPIWVYPRVRGEAMKIPRVVTLISGLSPRPRGSRIFSPGSASLSGSIPASAGKPYSAFQWTRATRVYPRVRGEAGFPSLPLQSFEGLSPRPRGSHQHLHVALVVVRSIPASAGKPTPMPMFLLLPGVYPRVRGEATSSPPPATK